LAVQAHGQHEVGLLHHLPAVEVEIGVVEEQRVVVGGRVLEVPHVVGGEQRRLRVDAELGVVGDVHRLGRRLPGGPLVFVDPEPGRLLQVALGGGGGGQQVLTGHHVGVDVVVGQGRVLVGAGDAGDVEPAVTVVVAERAPQAGRLHQDLEPFAGFELGVAGGVDVADHRLGDVGVDVEGGRPGRPVA